MSSVQSGTLWYASVHFGTLRQKGANMTFSEFVNRLHVIIGGGENTVAFTRSMLDAITTEEANELLKKYKNDAYKSYFNGNRSIGNFAKELTPYIEPEVFASFIADLPSDALREALCKEFADILPYATPFTIDKELSSLFADILRAEISTKRKAPQRQISEEQKESSDNGRTTVLDDWDNKITVIHHQTNVVQSGTNNVNLTNNGTMTFNL